MTIKMMVRLFIALMLATLVACTTLTTKPVKPTVELINVIPLNISLTEQKLRFNLRVSNPNNFELPVESINFIARFNDADIASGKNTKMTIIPANGEGTLTLDVTAGIDRLANTLKTLLEGQTLNLDYELAGTVAIKNWATPIPFDVTGAMDPKSGNDT
ncbi:hypothetical protein AB833_16910 [Chromatiales bacterium (ex Bugula neritina AB1)]|nr:hypothetical protein AB833_16910 [Chromatiales bacterium (ex Bugula neritina AB1)]